MAAYDIRICDWISVVCSAGLQVPDARRHSVRHAVRWLFLGAAAVREAGFQRAPLYLEIDIAHREAFVMTIGIATRAVAPAAYAHDSPIVDRTFDLLRFAARHRLQDAAAIPQRTRAGHEHDETAHDKGRPGIARRFAEKPITHRP